VNSKNPKHFRVLAIAPSTRGFGFAVLEGPDVLADWGVKTVQGNKNVQSLAKVEELITHYRPGVMVLQDTKVSRHAPRIKTLSQKIAALAATHGVGVELFSREQLRRGFFADGQGTKHAVAEIIAQRFPDELASRLPPKRKPWVSEHYQMGIFDALALAMVFRLKYAKRSRMAK
jgi:Holliday junction resolvasome RuvABC endonuclease subunit